MGYKVTGSTVTPAITRELPLFYITIGEFLFTSEPLPTI